FLYIVVFWMSKRKWKPYQFELVTVLLGSLSIAKGLWSGGDGYGMILPLAVFIGFHIDGRRSLAYATFFCATTTLLLYFDELLKITHVI
ncbi:sensor histidine kinase, partial [Bacillus sp. SIMBA_074]